MTQQINLYNPALRRQRDWLSARSAGLAALAALVLVLVGTAYTARSLGSLQAELAASQQALATEREQLATLAREAAARVPDAALTREVAQHRLLLQGRKEVLAALEGGALGSPTGFSGYLGALSRQTMDGLWLTGFDLGPAGQDMEIRGRMLNQSRLPEYIRRLTQEPVFKGRSFAALDMQGVEVKPKTDTGAAPVAQGAVPKDGASAAAPATPPLRYVEFTLRAREVPAGGEKK